MVWLTVIMTARRIMHTCSGAGSGHMLIHSWCRTLVGQHGAWLSALTWFRADARAWLSHLVSGARRGLVTKPGCTNKGVMQAQMIIAAQQACTKALSERICTEIRMICLLHD